MRIGIDLACWTNRRGYGRYTRAIVRALVATGPQHKFLGFTDPQTVAQEDFPEGLPLKIVEQSEPPARAASAHGRRRLSDMWRMSRAVRDAHLDLMFFPTHYSYFPLLGPARCVVAVHDAIAERWPQLIFPTLAGRAAWTVKSRLACWQADRVVTVSHAAASAIQERLGVPRERLRVVYEGTDPLFVLQDSPPDREQRSRVLEKYGIPADALAILYVGGFSPHKNLDTLVSAFSMVRGEAQNWSQHGSPDGDIARLHLVLVGDTTGDVFYSCYEALHEQVSRAQLQDRITFTGYVPDEDLAHLYRSALCLVLPSRDEGFGLPALEAMACGTPVVVSRVGGLAEVVGTAGILVRPGDAGELAMGIRGLVEDPDLRSALRSRGLRRAAAFSWERSAGDLLALFEELGAAGGGCRRPVGWRQKRRA